jgi:hypothetical protein
MQKIAIKHKRRIFKVKTSGYAHRSAQTMSWTLSFLRTFPNLSKFSCFLASRNKGQGVSFINGLVSKQHPLRFLSWNDFLPLFALI